MAPDSILMGGDAAKEQALQGGHSPNQPLRARLGTTLGGHYSVGGVVGEFRGDAFSTAHGPNGMNGPQGPDFSRGNTTAGPTLLPHGQQHSNSPQVGGSAVMPAMGGGVGNSGSVMSTAGPGGGHSAGASPGHH